ncbi:hypothetical protein FQN54_003412 [Arachnomyces sp. PD_36]|nr:hypothetical protein FQN54_003412 [Arachnomyces sp. PD_36]
MAPRLRKAKIPYDISKPPPPPDTSVPVPTAPPKVNFSDVETGLNMHQFIGFLEASSPERNKGGVGTMIGDLSSPTKTTTTTSRGGRMRAITFLERYGVVVLLYHAAVRKKHEADAFFVFVIHIDAMTTITRPAPTSPNGEPPPNLEWSSAVGHATTGKSGRVIHNLQEEIARLTRECSVQRSRADEAQRSVETYKVQLHGITDRLRNLEQVHETNVNSIARKDRKIESLRAEIEGERTRRLGAEEDSRKTTNLAAEERDQHFRDLAEAQENAKLNSSQYDALVKTTLKQKRGYETRFNELRDQIQGICDRDKEKKVQLDRLDVIISQKNREIDSGRERTERILQAFEEYKEERDQEIRDLIENAHKKDSTIDESLAGLFEVRDKMKWVMSVKDKVEGAE